MKNMVYIAKSIKNAVNFICINTDWARTGEASFESSGEKITVANSFRNLRGVKWDGAYVDYSFKLMPIHEQHEFMRALNGWGLKPIFLEDDTYVEGVYESCRGKES